MKEKRCRFCKTSFIPHPAVGDRQKICGDPACKKVLKNENNARWRGENLDYFRNDYPRLKLWLEQHPGYLRHYRKSHPEYAAKNREDQRARDRNKTLHLDIQAQLPLQPLEMTFLLGQLPCLDIQAHLDNCPLP